MHTPIHRHKLKWLLRCSYGGWSAEFINKLHKIYNIGMLKRSGSATEPRVVISLWLMEFMDEGNRTKRKTTHTKERCSVVYILFICSIYCFVFSAIAHLEYTNSVCVIVWALAQSAQCTCTTVRLHSCTMHSIVRTQSNECTENRRVEKISLAQCTAMCGEAQSGAVCWFSRLFWSSKYSNIAKNSRNICVEMLEFPIAYYSIISE